VRIFSEGFRRIAVTRDEPTAAYRGANVLRAVRPAGARGGMTAPVRAVVELYVPLGGLLARALLGGGFRPDEGDETRYEVQVADTGTTLDSVATCASSLGSPLVPGLVEEFADATLAALATATGPVGLPAGVLRVDRAGCGAEGSSNLMFGRATTLLHRVLAAELHGTDAEARIQEAVRRWRE
jgi:hypothetical protein